MVFKNSSISKLRADFFIALILHTHTKSRKKWESLFKIFIIVLKCSAVVLLDEINDSQLAFKRNFKEIFIIQKIRDVWF